MGCCYRQHKFKQLEEAELNHPVIAIRFNKDMRPAFLPEKKKDAGQETKKRHKGLHINLPENLPQSSIKINDCTITASYRHRYFVLSGVNAAVRTVNPQEAALKLPQPVLADDDWRRTGHKRQTFA